MKLSIIVPIYRVEAYLHRCIDSILAQTFTDFELILVDDGSPDRCPAICDEYSKLDSRIKVIHKTNGGLSDARNAGLDVARGEYIGFVDSDDTISEHMYKELISLLEHHGADMAVCGYLVTDSRGNVVGQWPSLTSNIIYDRSDFIDNFYPDVRRNLLPSACNKVYKRELFRTIRYPINKINEDAFIQLPLLDLCKKIVVCKDHYYHYFSSRPDSIQNSSYSEKRFNLIDFSLEQYLFFVKKNNLNQQHYTLQVYANYYMLNNFAVRLGNTKLKPKFASYRKQFNLYIGKIIVNPKICNLKKATIVLMFVNTKNAYKLARKFFPECLPDFLK